MYKLTKVLYGLKQVPWVWYERLSKFFLEKKFYVRKVGTTLFIKYKGHDLLTVQIYADDIIFGAINDSLCEDFSNCMRNEFEISMMEKLKFFLSHQIKQLKDKI